MKKPDELDPCPYSDKTLSVNFTLQNFEISDFLLTFSRMNTLNGGDKITKSIVIQTVLEFLYYDLGLRPSGFNDPDEIREFLKTRMK